MTDDADGRADAARRAWRRSMDDPDGFWLEAARAAVWETGPTVGVDTSASPSGRWFADGRINACRNALDAHVEAGNGDRVALIHDSPVTGTVERITYAALTERTARFAGVLRGLGVERGDRVLIYMPMIPEAVIAMLACARLGAIHSVVFGGFAAKELAVRIDDCAPHCIVAASCGIEPARIVEYKPLLDEAMAVAGHDVPHCVVFQREQSPAFLVDGRDHDWNELVEEARAVDCVPMASTDPLYILYTSGTTGRPKGVVRDTGGSVVSLKWSMRAIYGVDGGDVFWAASDIGWVVGHSYIVYGPLFAGCTTVLYEGKPVGTPDAGAFWRVIAEHGVKSFFTAPTAFRVIRKADPTASLLADHDVSSLEALYLAGERCDPDTLKWCEDALQVPVIDHWWQTETGWSICAQCRGLVPEGEAPPQIKPGSPSRPVPGHDIVALAPDGTEMPAGEIGALAGRLPLPPGTFTTLWNAEERYRKAYFDSFPGHYETGDAGYVDADGYVFVMARTDDVINVAGHRLSTGAMEEALANHPDVAECAVMGAHDEVKGQVPVGFVTLNSNADRPHAEIEAELVQRVRDEIGPVAAFRSVAVVERLPKTRSGKILRATMRSIADGSAWNMPATIEDPAVLSEIEQVLRKLGYAGASA